MSQSAPPPSFPNYLYNDYTIAFEGGSIACMLYGYYLVTAVKNLALLQNKNHSALLWYSVIQLVLTSLNVVIPLYIAPAQGLAMFGIEDTSYSPEALSLWPIVLTYATFVLNTWASDGFLLYRCYVAANKPAMVLPSLLYLATVGTSIAWLVVNSATSETYSSRMVQIANVCYWSCFVAMNICTSSIIFARLWARRQADKRTMSLSPATCLSYTSIMIESALVYTIFVVPVLVVFRLNSPLETVFFPVLSVIQAIAPSFIIRRIGRMTSFETSWQRDIVRPAHDVTVGSNTLVGPSGDHTNQSHLISSVYEMRDKA